MMSTGLLFTVVGLVLPALSAAATAAPENGPIVSKTVFQRPLDGEDLDAAHFDVNRDLGRAWIDVELMPDYTTDEQPEVFQQHLGGLYYDPARKQVIYRNGTQHVVCAEDSSFLGHTSLKETGQCKLRLSSEKRPVDDGFNVEQEIVGTVVFEARNPN
jgi:hypothetical protein